MEDPEKLVAALEALSLKENTAPAEIFKSFNDFVRVNNQQLDGAVFPLLEKFQPTTRIGRILKAKLIDRFQVHSEVLKLLQSCDSLDTNQALKCGWFFSQLDDPDNFVNQTLPSLSQSVRLKVINKYAFNLMSTVSGESLYLSLKARYGVRTAAPALLSCSESFIRDELPNLSGVLLRPNIVLVMYDKYPSLTIEYLTYLVDPESPHNRHDPDRYYSVAEGYTATFRKLSQTNLKAFLDMLDKHPKNFPRLLITRRPLKSLIKSHFDRVLGNFERTNDIFNCSKLFPRLTIEQFKKAYTTCILPGTLAEFVDESYWANSVKILDHLKPGMQSLVFREGFQTKYGKDPFSEEYLFKLKDHWMTIIPVEFRPAKVEKRLEGVEVIREQAEILAYLPLDQSFPRLKELIEVQSDPDVRTWIAKQMLKSLVHNKSFGKIKDVLGYLNKRFRNEKSNFRRNLVDELDEEREQLFQLEKDEWAPIDELIEIMKLNKEVTDNIWMLRRLLQKQLCCYYRKGIELDPNLQRYYELMHSSSNYLSSDDLDINGDTAYQRVFVVWFIKKILEEKRWSSHCSKTEVFKEIFVLVNKINSKDKENPFVLNDEFIDEFESLLKDPETNYNYFYDFRNIFEYTKAHPHLERRLLKASYLNIMDNHLLVRMLRTDPLLLLASLHDVVKKTFSENFSDYRPFYLKCRMFASYGIPQKLESICRETLEQERSENDEPVLDKSLAVRVLALLLLTSEFAELAEKYAPTQGTIEDYSEQVRDLFALQKALCQSFVDVSAPVGLLPLLRKFAVGDYLKITVGALNSVCARTPEQDVIPVLKEWTDCPVSLRKHILRIMYKVAPVEYSIEAFTDFFKKEKNLSLRRVIFLELHETFIAQPNNHTFQVLSSVIQHVNKSEEIVNDLFRMSSRGRSGTFMKTSYISQYLEVVWKCLPKWETVLFSGKTKLINLVDKYVVQLLTDEFCMELLAYALSTIEKSFPHFITICLLYAPSWEVQRSRLAQVIAALTPLVVNNWNERETTTGHVFKVRRIVSKFISELCEESRSCNNKVNASKILGETNNSLSVVIKFHNFVKHSFCLDAHILYLDTLGKEESSYESDLAGLYKGYVEKHGESMPISLVSVLSNVVPMVSSHIKLAHELVKISDHALILIIAVRIIEGSRLIEKELPIFNEIVESISLSENPDVQAAATLCFDDLEMYLP